MNDKTKARLKKHSREHGGMSSMHMKTMIKHMDSGDSFSVAHKKALTPITKKKKVVKRTVSKRAKAKPMPKVTMSSGGSGY